MPEIEGVLTQGGTAPLDFTLHDSQHAYRVAQRMADIIPSDVQPQLSPLEHGLLLLSAYLHDIGMTPERGMVQAHYHHLLTGESGSLTSTQMDKLQAFLDDDGRGLVPPIAKEHLTSELLRLTAEILTRYCRARHNDWSDPWIRSSLKHHRLSTYIDWIDDLVTLCRSHHEDYSELVGDRFRPRVVGSPGEVVHLRYLACVLRIADILEFDPERTPEVLFRHRDVSPASAIYWWKDHHISLLQEGNRLVFFAQPPSAKIHRAVEVTADQIDYELRLCRTLADETHFDVCPGLEARLPHRWVLPSSLYRDITPKDDAYVYVDGSFRPDTQKLLQLFGGMELYGSHLPAVRELLQNAFDAVREQIALERLSRGESTDPSIQNTLAQLHHVALELLPSADGYELVCTDDGVGMTKDIITNYFLVSGLSQRHATLALARRCREAGFTLERTAQFGIGVLSYFLLADRVHLITRRSQEAGDSEPTGWSFETEGVASFGELRPQPRSPRGTNVRLPLRTELLRDPKAFFLELREYLRWTLTRVPCSFRFHTALRDCQPLSFGPGWTGQQLTGLLEPALARIPDPYGDADQTPTELISSSKRQERESETKFWNDARDEMRSRLRSCAEEGVLPDGLGGYRLYLPYFELNEGASLAFLRPVRLKARLGIAPIGRGNLVLLRPGEADSYLGMRVHLRSAPRLPDFIHADIDWTSPEAGKLSLTRFEIGLSRRALKAREWLAQRATAMASTFVREHERSVFASLNRRIVDSPVTAETTLRWLAAPNRSRRMLPTWERISFPVVGTTLFAQRTQGWDLVWRRRKVGAIPKARPANRYEEDLCWYSSSLAPTHVVAYEKPWSQVLPLWSGQDSLNSVSHPAGKVSAFPPKWDLLCGVEFSRYTEESRSEVVWNRNHPLLAVVTVEGWEWCMERFLKEKEDPLRFRAELLADPGRGGAWVLQALSRRQAEIWDGLTERDPAFLSALWELFSRGKTGAAGKLNTLMGMYRASAVYSNLILCGPDDWRVYDEEEVIRRYMPDPGGEWCVNYVVAGRLTAQRRLLR